jgi:Ca2+-binding RTX toxin-like protein
LAGYVAEGVMRPVEDDDEENLPETDDDLASDMAPLSIFSMLTAAQNTNTADLDGMPRSSDDEPAIDASVSLAGGDGNDVITGFGNSDTIHGGSGQDMLAGQGGDDQIYGQDGEDFLYGDDGNDAIYGGAQTDVLHGHSGQDSLNGDAGSDLIYGHTGDDTLLGGSGQDQLTGGSGMDLLFGGADNDQLNGGLENDLVSGGTGQDEVDGGDGDDTLWGGAQFGMDTEQDFLNGGMGDDVLHLGVGDYGHGGMGADRFEIETLAQAESITQITDFNPSEDHLVVIYDAVAHPSPELSLATSESDGTLTLLLDGLPVANLPASEGFALSNVQLLAA